MRILVRFQQNSTAPLQDTKKSVLIDSPLDRQNDRAFDSDDGAARVSSTSPIYFKSYRSKDLKQVCKMTVHFDSIWLPKFHFHTSCQFWFDLKF